MRDNVVLLVHAVRYADTVAFVYTFAEQHHSVLGDHVEADGFRHHDTPGRGS